MIDQLTRDFERGVGRTVSLEAAGADRFRILTPFQFEDGDQLLITLRRHKDGGWTLTDEGYTFMQLSYELDESDIRSGNRQKIIANTLRAFGVRDQQGELILDVPDSQYGEALFSFVQAILKVSDVTFLSREMAKSTFLQDLANVLRVIPERHKAQNWSHPTHDPEGHYKVDWRLNEAPKPIFLFALTSDAQVQRANISLLKFETWGVPNHSLGVFENQEEISRDVLARFSDACDKQFSSLGDRERIAGYLANYLNLPPNNQNTPTDTALHPS